MATTYLTRTSWGTATNKQKFTQSFWVKRGVIGVQQALLGVESGGNNEARVLFRTDDTLEFYDYQSGYTFRYITNRKFRDCSAWYNIVLRVDTDNGTAANRVRIYINGVQETSFSTGTQPSRNLNTFYNSSGNHIVQIGRQSTGNSYFTGSMSHVNFCDGTTLAPTVFGSTDATTGEWEGNTSPSVTYGTNGYFILKDGNSVTDQSGRGNNFTVGGGTLTNLKDNPDNVFCTMNALSKSLTNVVLSKGNTVVRNDANSNGNVLGTIALGNGKYYWENYRHGGGGPGLGLTLASVDGSNHSAIHGSRVNYYSDGYIYQNGFGLSDINTGVSYGDTDIIGVSVDTENGTIKFYKNGALVANSTQTNSVFTYSQNELIPFWFVINGGEWRTNLGNGYFGTTAVSSAGTNASGNGIFEYNVPSGFTALSTKGLNL